MSPNEYNITPKPKSLHTAPKAPVFADCDFNPTDRIESILYVMKSVSLYLFDNYYGQKELEHIRDLDKAIFDLHQVNKWLIENKYYPA